MRLLVMTPFACVLLAVHGCTNHRGVIAPAPVPTSIGLGSNFDAPPETVICELRYYLLGYATRSTAPKGLEIIRNDGTNLTCSIQEPLKLLRRADTNLIWQVGGFVFQIVEPPRHAGKILTAHFDGPLASGDPFKAFEFGKSYQVDVASKFIGDVHFPGCY